MTMLEVFNDWLKVINTHTLIQVLNKIPQNNLAPNIQDVFKAFKLCSLKDCNVVFLGQDPYPQKGVATGILFGNQENVLEENLSPSLKVLKESVIDYSKFHNYPIEFDNTLESWASQGILMLNSALTVEINKIGSHTNLWRPFISQFLKRLSEYNANIIYVLFGQQAQSFESYIDKRCYIIKEKHPAFYARNGETMPSDVFTKVNQQLKVLYNKNIIWYKEPNEVY